MVNGSDVSGAGRDGDDRPGAVHANTGGRVAAQDDYLSDGARAHSGRALRALELGRAPLVTLRRAVLVVLVIMTAITLLNEVLPNGCPSASVIEWPWDF